MISFKNLRFLIVDDDQEIRETLKDHLELYEAVCEEAQDGLIAFDKIKKNKYDFVISDIRMPNASGIDLLNMVRDYEGVAPKIIMMSAFTDLTIEGAKELGALGLYLKPQNMETLLELIQENF
jgi:two-component system chemotaxis response regulator CheY